MATLAYTERIRKFVRMLCSLRPLFLFVAATAGCIENAAKHALCSCILSSSIYCRTGFFFVSPVLFPFFSRQEEERGEEGGKEMSQEKEREREKHSPHAVPGGYPTDSLCHTETSACLGTPRLGTTVSCTTVHSKKATMVQSAPLKKHTKLGV